MHTAPPRPQPPSLLALFALDEASLTAFEDAAVTFATANDWLGAKVVASLIVLVIFTCLCVTYMCRKKSSRVSFKVPAEDFVEDEPEDDALWLRAVARQARRVARDPPRRARRATRSLHELARRLRLEPDELLVTPPVASLGSPLPSVAKKPIMGREVIAKPVLDIVKQVDHAAKESLAGRAVNKAVESTAQQVKRVDHAVKESPAGRAVNKAVGSTVQQVKESSAGRAVNKAVEAVGGIFEPFKEAAQAYMDPDSNMPAPPPAYWRQNVPPDSPSASRRASKQTYSRRACLASCGASSGASKELV